MNMNMDDNRLIIAEYVWIDNFNQLRSKSRTIKLTSGSGRSDISIKTFPTWNFDGSSTGQAIGSDSEIILKPVTMYIDPFRTTDDYQESYLILCECYDRDGKPIKSNTRYMANKIFSNKIVKDQVPWYGLEQEYVLYDNKTKRPLGWPKYEKSYPEPQGKYYCSVGCDRAFGREIVEDHYDTCLKMGLEVSGINGEVMPGQWEYQIGPCEGISAGDQLWISRYVLHRICEKYDVYVSFDPKPEKGDWNGSGCHTNFSTKKMRQDGLKYIYDAIKKLKYVHKEHILVYGNNRERLIGTHETSSINTFTFGVADRTASIRIPLLVEKSGKGYIEDRRPASDCDPYLVTSKLAETVILN